MNLGSPVISDSQVAQELRLLHEPSPERELLAMIIRKPSLMIEAEASVRVEDLCLESSQAIYSCMLFAHSQAVAAGSAIQFDQARIHWASQWVMDPERFRQVTAEMSHVRSLQIQSQGVSLDNWREVIRAILDTSARMRLYREARRIQVAALNRKGGPPARQLAIEAESKLLSIAMGGGSEDDEIGLRKLGEAYGPWAARANLALSFPLGGVTNIYCPLFPRWMKFLNWGFERGGLTVVGARTKVGKSTLVQEIARTLALLGIPVLILDNEMTRREVWTRALSAMTGLSTFRITNGLFTSTQGSLDTVTQAAGALASAPLYYARIAGKPVEYALALMRQFRQHVVGERTLIDRWDRPTTLPGQGLVIYDWIKLPDLAGLSKGAAEWQLVGDLCTKLKSAAADLDLPVIAGAQGNRNAINKSGAEFADNAESFVSQSDRIAQFCSCLCMLRNITRSEVDAILATPGIRLRPAVEDGDVRSTLPFNQVLHIILQRNGPSCFDGIPLYLHRGMQRYEEMAWHKDAGGQYPLGEDGRPAGQSTGYMELLSDMVAGRKKAKKGGAAEPAPAPASALPPGGPQG